MGVEIAFLNDLLQENVYVEQHPWFFNHALPDYVIKIDIYMVWNKLQELDMTLMFKFLIDHDFIIGNVDKTLFKFMKCDNSLLVQI